MCVLYSRSTDEDRRTRLIPWWLDNTVRVAACDHHRAAGHCRAARCWALPERIMHNDMYQVMFGPSSAGNGGRGRIAAGSAVAGSAVLRRLTASRVPEGVRRHGVARIDDAQSLCVYDVWPSSARSAARGAQQRWARRRGAWRRGGWQLQECQRECDGVALQETTMMQNLMMSTMFVLSSARSVEYGGSAGGGCVGVKSNSKNFGGVESLGRSAAGVDCPLRRIICCVEVVRCRIIF